VSYAGIGGQDLELNTRKLDAGVSTVRDYLRDLPLGLTDMAVEAVNATVKQGRKRALDVLSGSTGVSRSILTRRKRVAGRLAKRGNPFGKIFIGLNPVPAIDVGKTPANYPGSFYATIRPGGKPYRGIFERVGRDRWPIRQLWEPLEGTDAAFGQLSDELAALLADEFEKALGNV